MKFAPQTRRWSPREWAQKDPDALRRFIASKPDLSRGDRTALHDALKPPPDA